MKRFHAHIAVENLETSIAFYSKLFGAAPSKQQVDYAKWMLEDPRINFAISTRGHAVGLNHFGFQVDTAEELLGLKKLADAATEGKVRNQSDAACCYAKSDKHWTIDPQGIAWEHFHTMADAAEFGSDTAQDSSACCLPRNGQQEVSDAALPSCAIANKTPAVNPACCTPRAASSHGACCG